jgi:MFS family permease
VTTPSGAPHGHADPRAAAGDDSVPVSIRLGAVVPPEDPEDWSRPLTWLAAAGMLAAPLFALTWFLLAAPAGSRDPLPATWLTATILALGAAATGATQLGATRAVAATLGAGLFAALGVVIIGAISAAERQAGIASPTLAHGFAAGVAGLAGTLAAGTLAGPLADRAPRLVRWLVPGAVGAATGLLVVPLLFG